MKKFLSIAFLLLSLSALQAQNTFTVYVIPSAVKYDWSSPNSLYKSYVKNYIHNLFRKDCYILGHAFVELRSPLIPEGIFTGMKSDARNEQTDMVKKQHYGLAILGADIKGKLETPSDLELKVEKYAKKGKLAFMTFLISDEATERMISFFEAFKEMIGKNGSDGARYGGAFWPRYEGEGAGCSAFAVSFLDLAGILQDEFDEWLVQINIPMALIGGPYNNYNEVKLGDIKKHDSWASENDTAAFEYFEIYDPSLMFDWIHERLNDTEPYDVLNASPVELKKAKGLSIDSRSVPVPDEESIFREREKPSIFIDYYFRKLNGN